jgi:hypothetical protein
MRSKPFLLVVLVISVLLLLTFAGVVAHPLKMMRKITRKVIYPTSVQPDLRYDVAIPPVGPDWEIKHPNVTLISVTMGGFGNTLITLASAYEACINLGLKPPILSIENGGDFDFHKIGSPRFDFPDGPESLSEFFPWINIVVTDTFLGLRLVGHQPKIWKARTMEDFPISRTVIQIVDYSSVMRIGDHAFDLLRRNINPKIMEYIRRNYEIADGSMAVHLRLGQPTDDFIPTSPSAEQIVEYHNKWVPSKVFVFTDNKVKAKERMAETNLAFVVVEDVNYIECLLMSMCSSAIVSESTFAVGACRLGGMKKVAVPGKLESFRQDESWLGY